MKKEKGSWVRNRHGKTTKNIGVYLYLTEIQDKWLEKEAAREKISKSAIIRDLIDLEMLKTKIVKMKMLDPNVLIPEFLNPTIEDASK